MADNSDQLQLSYAAKQSWYRRRVVRRFVLWGEFVTVAVVGWRWGPAAYTHAEYLYWQRQCMEWAAPVGTVAYEDNPSGATALLKSPDYKPMPLETAAYLEGSGYNVPAVAILQAPAAARVLPAGALHDGIVFMHRLRSPAGNARLVVIRSRLWKCGRNGYTVQLFFPLVLKPAPYWPFEPAEIVGDPSQAILSDFWMTTPKPEWGDLGNTAAPYAPTLRLFAGQVDPNDSSHFTIAYEYCQLESDETTGQPVRNWRTGVMHGWLRDNDTLAIQRTAGWPD